MSQTVVRNPETILAASTIVREECAGRGITPDDLLGGSRRGPVVRARQACMWRLYMELHLSMPQVGWLLGRDHTTVLYALDRLQRAS